jgi:hypothetical protein
MARCSPKFRKYFEIHDRVNYGFNSKYISLSKVKQVYNMNPLHKIFNL